MCPVVRGTFFSLLFAVLLAPMSAAAGASTVAMPAESGGSFAVPVTSLKGMRFRNTIHQQYDFSCGSAALATLLTHHYDFPVGEQDVFREMYEHGDQPKIRREGFSLLDIKNYLEAHGFEADGFVAELDQLVAAAIPAIVLVKENGYFHFVVLKGVRGGRVLIGDPSNGTRAVQLARFKEMWVNQILFVILNKQEQAHFNRDVDWRVAPSAPLAQGIQNAVQGMPLPKYGPSDF
jgi:predicted double-glycine peptidase